MATINFLDIKNNQEIIDYMNNNKLTDSDMKIIKKIAEKNISIEDNLKKLKKRLVSNFMNNPLKLEKEPFYLLSWGYQKGNSEIKDQIYQELYSRFTNKKIKDSIFFHFIEKNENEELLSKLSKEHFYQYYQYLQLFNLDKSKEFSHFAKLQQMPFNYEQLTTLSNFAKSLSLWDKEYKNIQNCFLYFYPDTISLIIDKGTKEQVKSLIENYVSYHTKDQTLLFKMFDIDSTYGKEKIKEKFKTQISFLCRDLKLVESLELLKKLTIEVGVLDPHSHSVKNKL